MKQTANLRAAGAGPAGDVRLRSEQFHDVRSQVTTVNEFNNGGTAVFHTSYAYDVMDDARSRHRMCQRVIVEQRIT